MKQSFILIIKQFIFWLVFFALLRALFLIYYFSHLHVAHIPVWEVLQTFYYALPVDISSASYVLVVPFLLQLAGFLFNRRWLDVTNKVYSALVIFVYLLITTGELAIYGEWKTKLSYKALSYLERPDEVFNSYTTSGFFFLTMILLIGFLFFFWIYIKKVYPKQVTLSIRNGWAKLLYLLIVPFLLFSGIRGGWQAIPITSSVSYFSKQNILNLAAINNGYNLVFSLLEYREMNQRNVFSTLPPQQANQVVKQLHQVEKDTTISILNIARPNIVILLLESFSGDLLESLGGIPGITSRIHELEKEGLLFTNFYATGNRSQQAMASIYGGLPALPVVTLTNYPEKYGSVPSLITQLRPLGYHTSFFFGGQLNYGNIKSFLVSNHLDLIVEGKDLDAGLPRGKLGVHDVDFLNHYVGELNQLPEPFFSTAFTLSSHSPYDQPGLRTIDFVEFERDFVNSANYTDSAVGQFFKMAKLQPWFSNTLFIIMADHSHNSYHNYPLESFEYHQIPLLLLGGALKDSLHGLQDDRLFSNVDITATLLHQLGQSSEAFFWSKNMFNPFSPRFAYFDLNDGFGWKRDEGYLVMNIQQNTRYHSEGSTEIIDSLELQGRSYVQVLFDEFLGY